MALTFAYRTFTSPGSRPVWPLFGRRNRPRPVIDIGITGPGGHAALAVLLDTGADDTVFPIGTAASIGLDLAAAPARSASGVGLVSSPIWFAEVRLRISDGRESREWPARVGFTSAAFKRGIAGFAGFFQFFTATFDGERERVEVAVNALYPGT